MSTQKKFKADDKVVWDDLGYWEAFFSHTDPKQILTVSHYGDEEEYENNLVFFENLSDADGNPVGVFDWRFRLVESVQELAEAPSNQGKTCSQNCISCKDKETPVLGDKDGNAWFKRGELPPIGGKVVFYSDDFENEDYWSKDLTNESEVEVIAHITSSVKRQEMDLAVFVFQCSNGDRQVEQAVPCCFRPIKTAEEIAKEQEREETIAKINDVLMLTGSYTEAAEALCDAGLRFVGEGVQYGD